jgi:hypothetical protein
MMNRDPCAYRAPPEGDSFPVTRMQLDKGYEIQRNAGDPQEIYDRVEKTTRITNALHLLNVFLNFQDLFQSNERVSDGKSEVADKNYVYSHPLLATEWGRQQAKLPVYRPVMFKEATRNKKTVVKAYRNYNWTMVELALDGSLWSGHPDFQLMKDKKFQVCGICVHALSG